MRIYWIIPLFALLVSCGGGSTSQEVINQPEPILEEGYILAGQSNVGYCDWSYLEDRLETKTVSIHYNGAGIYELIHRFKTEPEYKERIATINPQGIIFVHGEEDGRIGTPGQEYADLVEQYRQEISLAVGKELRLIISTVGYRTSQGPENYDALRDAMNNHNNPYWTIGFNGAKDFISLGYLVDWVHFNESGCITMMDSLIESIND